MPNNNPRERERSFTWDINVVSLPRTGGIIRPHKSGHDYSFPLRSWTMNDAACANYEQRLIDREGSGSIFRELSARDDYP